MQSNRYDLIYALLFGCLYFLALCLNASDTIKTTALVLAAVGVLVMFFHRDVFRERLCIPFLALTLFVLMDGISTFYALSGKFALREFLKVLCAFCFALIILGLSPRIEKIPGSRMMTALAVCGALGSLVSIDLLSTRLVSGAVLGFLSLFTEEFKWLDGVEVGVRMTSMFVSPNTFAGFSGIAVLLSLGLALAAEQRKHRNLYLVLLYVNALGFILAFSLGASIFMLLAFLVLLLLQPAERKGDTLVLMLETFVLVLIAAALISTTSFKAWDGMQPIPLACAVIGAIALCFLDMGIKKWFTIRIKPQKRSLIAILAILLVLIIVFLLLAWNLTGAAELSKGETLRRAIYLKPGEYTLDLQYDGGLTLRVESQNRPETIMHTNTEVFSGNPAGGVVFTVPEDSLVQYFNFYAAEDTLIQSASCGGTKVPLEYKLLPGFIANRLQGLFANQNAIQRLVFFEDGLKMFKRSPIVGLGMGAYENAIKSVQSFYYETKYAHDHYIQVLAETGLIGIILFIGMLVLHGSAVWRSRKTKPYAPVLGAALVFMAGHAIVEVVFSMYAYLPMAFGTFALIDLSCGDAVTKPKLSKLAKTIGMWVIAAFIIVYCFFVAGNIAAKNLIEREPTLDSAGRAVRMDKFEWADYALAYVTNTMGDNVGLSVRLQADEYAERLSKVDSNTVPIYLAQYYFNTNRLEKGIQMLEKYVDYVASDVTAWQNAFDLLQQVEEDSGVYSDGISRMIQKLDDWNTNNMGNVQLSKETLAFLEKYR